MKRQFLIVAILVAALHGCSSRKIEEKYVGCYVPSGTAANDYGLCFYLHYKGECQVSDQSGNILSGTCRMSGNTGTMNVSFASSTFSYPEFRQANVTFTIDGDTLTTVAGRKFVKKGSPTETARAPTPESAERSTVAAPPPPPSLDEQAMKIGRDTFESFWIQCGDSYYTWNYGAPLKHYIQWRNVGFTLRLDPINDVARMNGLEWSGQVAVQSSYSRNGYNQKWESWDKGGIGLVFVKRSKTGWEARYESGDSRYDRFKKPTCQETEQIR